MILGRVEVSTAGIDAVLSEAKKRNITLKGARAAAKILKAAARGEAPKRSGATKQAQAVKAEKGKKGATISFAVQGVKKKFVKMYRRPGRKEPEKVVPAFIDHLIQLGTKPHRTGKGESLGRSATSRRAEVKRTNQATGGKHPGAKPNPYRQRAWLAVKDRAGAACVAEMAKGTQKEIERAAAKVAKAAKAAAGK
jgi:hypothetical protein